MFYSYSSHFLISFLSVAPLEDAKRYFYIDVLFTFSLCLES